MLSLLYFIGLSGFLTPGAIHAAPVPMEVTAEEKFQAAMIAAIHLFVQNDDAENLDSVLTKYPKLVNEKQRFREPRKPSPTDAYVPIHCAAQTGRTSVAKVLLQHRADPNVATGSGWTPLHIAAQNGNLDVLKVLLEGGARPDLKTEPRPESNMIPPSSPPGAMPVFIPALPAMTPLDVAVHFKKNDVAAYLKSKR
jgi:hypothetical protein